MMKKNFASGNDLALGKFEFSGLKATYFVAFIAQGLKLKAFSVLFICSPFLTFSYVLGFTFKWIKS